MKNALVLRSLSREMFDIEITESAQKEFKKIDKKNQGIISKKILTLKNGLSGTKRLSGFKNIFRVRAGNFRIIFEITSPEKILKITYIRRRNEKTFKF